VAVMSQREQVREFLAGLLRQNQDDASSLSDSDSLVLSGRLTSLDVVDTLTFLEERFGFEMDPIDFDQKKFDSVNSIVAMLEEAGVKRESA
jgi:acyl carrier protein